MRSLSRLFVASLLALLVPACAADLPEIPDSFDPERAASTCVGKCDGGDSPGPLAALPNATVATWFAPYENALGADLALIDQVTRARTRDANAYAEGDNPYSIRYAVYNLRNQAISSALADAVDAGVDVQILIEQDQLDPERTWNTTDEMLIARGFEFVENHRDLTDATRRTADLVGVSGSGLMHLKARIYQWRDSDSGAAQRRLITGSMNPGDLAAHNDETLHYVEDAAVIDAFVAKYEAVRDGRSVVNTWRDDAPLQVLFSPDGGVQTVDRIATLIDNEQELIWIAVYSLRNVRPRSGGKGILDRLVDAHRRGVTVAVITDRKQSDGVDADGNRVYWNDGGEDILRDAGIPVYEVVNRYSPYNAMHAKYGVFGLTNPIVVTGAANWTRAGIGDASKRPRNAESALFIDSNALDGGVTARRFLGNFIDIVRRYAGADDNETEGPAASKLFDTVQGLEAWPMVAIEFEATGYTSWGQSLYVTGASAELGDWTRSHLGWPLYTDAASYPSWQGEALMLPLGARVGHKLIKSSGGGVSWESGDNRTLIADPTDERAGQIFPGESRVVRTMTWR